MSALTSIQIKIIQALVDEKGGAVAAGDFYRNMSPSDLDNAIRTWAINRAAAIDSQIASNNQENTILLAEKETYKTILKG